MSLFEIIIAMMLMIVLCCICIRTLRQYITRDTDIIKFRHVYGSISQIAYELANDPTMYSVNEKLADTSEHSYPIDPDKTYGGQTKFKELFKSRFNIYNNNINIKLPLSIPQYDTTITNASGQNITTTTYISNLRCFMDNKGTVFCPSDTSKNNLSFIYVPVFLENKNTTNIEKIIIFQISKKGKIDLPVVIKSENGTTLINCYNQEYINNCLNQNQTNNCNYKNYNEYTHCKVIDKLLDMNF